MRTFYKINCAQKRSCIEILPNIAIDGNFIDAFIPYNRNRLPEQTEFFIKACKKEYDIICIHNCINLHFYSKELISILDRFSDMSDMCYKIDLHGSIKEYYVIYNLPTYRWINEKERNIWVHNPCLDYPPIRFVIEENDNTPIFSARGICSILVPEEIMKAMKKAKLTNIEFAEAYGYTPEEALEWARQNPEYADNFADKQWFKKLLDK